jgi:hypothetical protein
MANTWTNFYPTLWSDQAYFEFAAAAIAPQVVNTTWVDPGGPSDSVRIPKFQFSTGDIDDVSNLIDSPDNVSEATLVLPLDKNKGFHFQVLYEEQDQANVQLGESILMQRTQALAAIVDQNVFNVASGAATTITGSVVKATLVSAIELLNENNAPQSDRVLVVNPDAYSDLLNTDDFVRADSITGATANRTGLVGEVLGLDVFMSNNIPSAVGDAICMHRVAIAMAMLRAIDIRVFDQPRHFSVGYTGRAIWGQTLIDGNLVVPIDRA